VSGEDRVSSTILLLSVYRAIDEKKQPIALAFLKDTLGWSPNYVLEVADDLAEKGMLTMNTKNDKTIESSYVTLTKKGIEQIEMSEVSKCRQKSATPRVTLNFNAPVNSVQTGSQNYAVPTMDLGIGVNEVLSLLSELHERFQHLPASDRNDGLDCVDGLTDEIKSNKPRSRLVGKYLKELATYATKVGAESLITRIFGLVGAGS